MAELNFTPTSKWVKGRYYTFESTFANTDTSKPIEVDFPEYCSVSVSWITAGEIVTLQWSIDWVAFFDLKDSAWTITFNADWIYNANISGVAQLKVSKTWAAPVTVVVWIKK